MTDLKPNKSLLNNAFVGYKLASSDLNTQSLPLVAPINGVSWNQEQYSYAHVRTHEMHNHLYSDQFFKRVYFTDENGAVNIIEEDADNSSFYEVFKIPKHSINESGSAFSESLLFPSNELAILSDGKGFIYLINTGPRNIKDQKWSIITENPVYDIKSPAIVLSANAIDNLLHVLVFSLKDIQETGAAVPSTKVMLHWLQIHLSLDNQSECSVKGIKLFMGKNVPNAQWFSSDYSYLLVAADSPFHLADAVTYEKIVPLIPLSEGQTVDKFYRWHQSKELVSIAFDFHVTEKEIIVELKHNSISVKLSNGKILLEGSLEQEVIMDASKWFVEKNRLEITLIKKEAGPFWINILKNGDKHGVHDILGEEEENMNNVHESLAHLTSDGNTKEQEEAGNFNMQQLEECDQDTESEMKLFSVNVFTGKIETLKNLSGHQWLFVKQLNDGEAPLICLRHDVDGILWKPSRKSITDWDHHCTFDALGYVQASKENHKFTTCNSEFKHAVITDCTTHVYIYEADQDNKTEHKQYVKTLTNCEIILGCQAIKDKFYILTDKHINIIELPRL